MNDTGDLFVKVKVCVEPDKWFFFLFMHFIHKNKHWINLKQRQNDFPNNFLGLFTLFIYKKKKFSTEILSGLDSLIKFQ